MNVRTQPRLTRIQRDPHAHERVSLSLMDWAPERIEYLLEQGEADAERVLGADRVFLDAAGNEQVGSSRQGHTQAAS
ncbi:MAG: hypothetical protein WED00_05610 [Aquisalimonadaceae bacterium]